MLSVGSWQEPFTSCSPSLLVYIKQSEVRGRCKRVKTGAADGRTASISRLQTILRPITMNEAVKNSTAADWSFVEQWLAHGFVSWLSCAEQTWTQVQLDNSFPLLSDYGDKQPAINRCGSRLVECLGRSKTMMREHMSLCSNACQCVKKTVLTIKHDQEHAWDLDSYNGLRRGHAKILESSQLPVIRPLEPSRELTKKLRARHEP